MSQWVQTLVAACELFVERFPPACLCECRAQRRYNVFAQTIRVWDDSVVMEQTQTAERSRAAEAKETLVFLLSDDPAHRKVRARPGAPPVPYTRTWLPLRPTFFRI